MKLFISLAILIIILTICAIIIARKKEQATNTDAYNPIYYTLIVCIVWMGIICPLIPLIVLQ